MPATDRVTIFFTQNGDRFWTNRFYVNALDLDAAAAWANVVLTAAMASHLDDLFSIVKTDVDHLADDSFISTPLSIPGASTNGHYLPLFNTIKVNVNVAGHGRNDYKFVRGWLVEAVVDNGQIDSTFRDQVDDVFNDLIADSTASGVDIVDLDGNLWQVAATQAAIQMRQLHRKRKKVTP